MAWTHLSLSLNRSSILELSALFELLRGSSCAITCPCVVLVPTLEELEPSRLNETVEADPDEEASSGG